MEKRNKYLKLFLNLNEIHDVDSERASQISKNMIYKRGIFRKKQLKSIEPKFTD